MAEDFDFLTGDPTQQIAARLGQKLQGPAEGAPQVRLNLWRRGAEPLPAGGGPPGGPPGAPGGQPPAPPQPQVYQSPPDLAQMYMALSQQLTRPATNSIPVWDS